MTKPEDATVPAVGSQVERGVGRHGAEVAFERWRDLQPYGGATDRERRAFLAGFKAATEPLMPTRDELMAGLVADLKKQQADEAARRAALPAGVCPECDGAGEQGGQFCGGFWKCESCGGNGKTPNAELTGPRRAEGP